MYVFFIILLLIVAAAAGIFLWPARRSGAKKVQASPRPFFETETAQELGLSIPASASPAALSPDIQLPRSYGVDRLALMARDPRWLFAYWEITATKQEEFKVNFGPEAWISTHPVIRVYDVTGVDFNGKNANKHLDFHIEEHIDNWHIEVGEPDRSFCVDVGRMFPDGRFITLLRSNVVTTPRESLSDRLDEEWMWIEGLYRSIGRFQYGTSSPLIIEELALRKGEIALDVTSPGHWNPRK